MDIIKAIHTLFPRDISIGFSWLRGHSGIFGNEKADLLAKEGALSNATPIYNLVPISAVTGLSADLAWDNWAQEWINTGPKQIKFFIPQVSLETTQFITNHGNFGDYLFKKNICSDSICQNCFSCSDKALHLLFDCPYFNRLRNDTLAKVKITNSSDLKNVINDNKLVENFKIFCNSVIRDRNSNRHPPNNS